MKKILLLLVLVGNFAFAQKLTKDQLSEKFYNVIMNDCYLTCSLSEEKLYSDKSIIDFLIKNSINKVESSFNIHKDEKVKYAVANLGYSEKTNEWWGWSHRAKFHFTIGSEVKVGDVAYVPTNKEDYKNSCLHFWDDYIFGMFTFLGCLHFWG